jgi:hypothetical protein
MANTHKPLLTRITALLAGPYLLGQRALTLPFPLKEDAPKESSPKNSASRLTVTPPEHAIKRRG